MVGDILQPTHLLFVLVVALLVLGPKRLPEVAKTLGNGLRDFRSALSGDSHRDEDEHPRGFLPPEETSTEAQVSPAPVVHEPETASVVHEPEPDKPKPAEPQSIVPTPSAPAPAPQATQPEPAPAPQATQPEPEPKPEPAPPAAAPKQSS